jgi:hypothetical protein
MARTPEDPLVRLCKHSRFDPATGCLTTDHAGVRGYPMVKHAGTSWRVNVLAYRLLVGPIPTGFQVDHACRNKRCWAPWHLEAVSSGENVRRERNSRTACRHGHPVPESWRLRADGRRECVHCVRKGDRERKRAARNVKD